MGDPLVKGAAASAAAHSAVQALHWCERQLSGGEVVRGRLLEGLSTLPARPSDAEVIESGNCGKCRVDWFKTGPECAHCKLEGVYNAREACLFSYRRQRKVEAAMPAINAAQVGRRAHLSRRSGARSHCDRRPLLPWPLCARRPFLLALRMSCPPPVLTLDPSPHSTRPPIPSPPRAALITRCARVPLADGCRRRLVQ
eukprot:5175282-Prymnesium_polylepis.1